LKIRNGFVSNSSTSSFCLIGTCISFDTLLEYVEHMGRITKEDIEEAKQTYDDDGVCNAVYGLINAVKNNKPMQYEISIEREPYDDSHVYVGVDINAAVKDDKIDIRDIRSFLSETLGIPTHTVDIHQEAWDDH